MNIRLWTLCSALPICLAMAAAEPFVGHYVNREYGVHLHINMTEKNIVVPDQEIFGELDGYFGCNGCTTVWPIVAAERQGAKAPTALIDVINNYGSEDFTATLTATDDTTLVFEHRGGSTFKFPVNKKWHKVPSKMKLVRAEH